MWIKLIFFFVTNSPSTNYVVILYIFFTLFYILIEYFLIKILNVFYLKNYDIV